jgi:pyrroloquinoline quinone (PQQ) biosynthesis protein C
MLADALRTEIERYAVRMRRSNPLFFKAEDGTLTAENIANYLVNVRYILTFSPIYLRRARDGARRLGDERLAMHYEHKFDEEVGHDVWAERDIASVSKQATAHLGCDPVPSAKALIGYLGGVIDEDPALYLAYILFVEYLTVLAGPDWLQLLEDRCGIPRSSMSVIANHAELDRDHVEEALDCIDELVGDPRKLARMREVLLESIVYFERFATEATQHTRPHDARPSRSVPQQISAA